MTTTRLDVMMAGNATLRRLTLAGRIDDSATLASLVDTVKATDVVIDTGGVVFVNSIGVREWMRFLRGLAATGSRIRLENVSEVLVTQMNLIPDLRTGVTTVSVQAPYECANCGAETSQLIDLQHHGAALRALKPPTFACPECGGALALADYPDRYFAFLRA